MNNDNHVKRGRGIYFLLLSQVTLSFNAAFLEHNVGNFNLYCFKIHGLRFVTQLFVALHYSLFD